MNPQSGQSQSPALRSCPAPGSKDDPRSNRDPPRSYVAFLSASFSFGYPVLPTNRKPPLRTTCMAASEGGSAFAASRSHAAPARSEPATCSAMAAHAASATLTASAERGTRAVAKSCSVMSVSATSLLPAAVGSSRNKTLCTHVSLSKVANFSPPPHTKARSFPVAPGSESSSEAASRVSSHAAPTAPIRRSLSAPAGAACAAYAFNVLLTSPKQFFTSPACILSNVLQGVGLANDE
mmetsp:Transcript_1054/g.4091  ORF Transcript_1054/g.4091 Transcript_1054/m.4091 type:complete len:237 (+) Transcript_1054:488-1198(+)